jgi:hypothetical protein
MQEGKTMRYDITLTFNVGKLKTEQDATDFANSLAERALDTFNDDSSIHKHVWYKVKARANP